MNTTFLLVATLFLLGACAQQQATSIQYPGWADAHDCYEWHQADEYCQMAFRLHEKGTQQSPLSDLYIELGDVVLQLRDYTNDDYFRTGAALREALKNNDTVRSNQPQRQLVMHRTLAQKTKAILEQLFKESAIIAKDCRDAGKACLPELDRATNAGYASIMIGSTSLADDILTLVRPLSEGGGV